MDRVLQDRRSLLLVLTGGTALLLFAATRNSNPLAAPSSIPVPEVSVAQAKALLDAGAIAIDVRDAKEWGQRTLSKKMGSENKKTGSENIVD